MLRLLIGIICILGLTSFHKPKISDCEIVAFYKAVTPISGTKVMTSNNDLEELELLLVPISINSGKYVVSITRKCGNLYKVDDKNIYIETKYCYEYSYSDEVILKIDGDYYTKGKIIF
jgi:hypothetical protein